MNINNINKNKITAIVYLSLTLLALTGYFIWVIFSRPTKPKSEQVFIPPAIEKPLKNPLSSEKLNIPTLPMPTSTKDFFEEINKAAKTAETKLKNEIATPTPIAPVTPSVPSAPSDARILKTAPTEIILSLTDDEFHYLYPDAFIASLIDAQNLLIKSYDPAYKPLLKIENDSQVRYVEEKIVAAFLSTNMITEEKAERFITTIRFTLPQLQLTELKNRNSSASNQSFINQCSILSPQPSSNGLFLAGLVEKLYSAFIPKAQAYCGVCYDLPLCYQFGAPGPGFIIFRIACYCTGCLYGQGCLDFCTGKPAIYDLTTGICGCG